MNKVIAIALVIISDFIVVAENFYKVFRKLSVVSDSDHWELSLV